MQSFCESYGLKSLIKEPICYKTPENPSKIFQNSCVLETGLSDFHKTTVSVLKKTFTKLKPRVIHYRDYKMFSNEKQGKPLALSLCDCNAKCRLLSVRY